MKWCQDTGKINVLVSADSDWSKKTDVQREMRRRIKRRLPNEVYTREEQERLAAALIDLLRVRKGR